MLRHGESLGNILDQEVKAGNFLQCTPENLSLGDANWPLTEVGRQETVAAGKVLQEQFPDGFDTIICSPYTRTVQTLMCLGYGPYRINPLLREQNLGDFVGKDMLNYIQAHQAFNAAYAEDIDLIPPNGESIRQVQARIQAFWESERAEMQGKCTLIITHWLPMFLTRCLFSGVSIDDFKIVLGLQRTISNCQFDWYTDLNPITMVEENTILWHQTRSLSSQPTPWQQV